MAIPNLLPKTKTNLADQTPASFDVDPVSILMESHEENIGGSVDMSSPLSEQRRTAPQLSANGPTTFDLVSVPLLGKRTVGVHQRVLGIVLAVSLMVLVGAAAIALNRTDAAAQQLKATGQALMQSQRVAKTVSQALVGSPQAFIDLGDSAAVLAANLTALNKGDVGLGIAALGDEYRPMLDRVLPLAERTQKNATTILGEQNILQEIGAALQRINRQSEDLLELTKTISSMKQQQSAPSADISAIGELSTLTQRIGKSSNEFLTSAGVSAEAVFLLGKDLNSFSEISQGLLDGSTELRLSPTQDKPTRERLAELIQMFENTRVQAGAILKNLQGLVASRTAQTAVIQDSEPLRQQLEALQVELSRQARISVVVITSMALSGLIALLSAIGLAYAQLQDSQNRQKAAEAQRQDAEDRSQESEFLEQAAKRVNDANQTAILRLMNELQTVAEGDLTREATVSEDITGAIADSLNYTVEELRSLVSNVQRTADHVAQTTTAVDQTSSALLVASNAQLLEIREAGRSVVEMAVRITEVSTQAQESALVARQSRQAAETGLQAVQNAIGGMNTIRNQIQETSKRIKRLGESSQEIGEITELISEITEQTNVLALNAAIQAASAGEAGRGFSVVAEEVQRLAERSADATRQIAALVKVIQTDTQNAIGAMELSAQGVVSGAKLSDNAGAALSEIDEVSRRVAEQIEQISSATSREAGLANSVADNIQHIFAVTEQTVEGTRATAMEVRELSRSAQELRKSVARFKIS